MPGRPSLFTVKRLLALAALAAAVLLAGVAVVLGRDLGAPALPPVDPATRVVATSALAERGAYLARTGNCAACHTARGGMPYAGGRPLVTPFGTVFAGNLTPDEDTGLGRWSADAFWRAMHRGQSRDGRLLVPAFPYDSTTRITREDSDALFAFLMSLPAVKQVTQPHALRWPYSTQFALAAWRALYFEPQSFVADTDQSAEWNRGAYLVTGLGHCAACHATRNALGGVVAGSELTGGSLPEPGWYAPSLHAPSEGGVTQWDTQRIVNLLRDGIAHEASAVGPMAEVVYGSTQHLSEPDLRAMAAYLQALDPRPVRPVAFEPARSEQRELGARVYEQRCADCHGEQGQGAAGIYPALAGNRAVTQASAANPVLAVLGGGFPPATAGNPKPFGMPPYRTLLTDVEIAAVVTHLRQSWGNQASAVPPQAVQRLR
ncbi:cytochrome c [Hydrogenophaga sp.]|uniref:cytochrome c n=1 Tax=Hydrogenophaga sp. TaxID=1904254 RepID=UPI00262D1310|nr:cytochrome c [Hydrogenophaga sp.]MDM7951280.1 cytochrome c [Hydrogenophaga sp.]